MLVATVKRAVTATGDSVLRADLSGVSFTGLRPPRTPTQMRTPPRPYARAHIRTALHGMPTGR
jgi:hypothetical protein